MRLKTFFIFIFFLILSVCYLQERTPVFASNGASHTFYLYSASSNATAINVQGKNVAQTTKYLKGVKGESVFFDNFDFGDRFVKQTLKEYKAVKVFSESVDDITCDYYYSSQIYSFVLIGLKRVNLHVIKSQNGITIATPLAFDGF